MGNCCRTHKPIDEEPEPLLDKQHLLRLMHEGAIRRVRAAVEGAARNTSCTVNLYASDENEQALLRQAAQDVTEEPDLIRCKIDDKQIRFSWDIGYTQPPVYKQ
jgi:hypothetical protein